MATEIERKFLVKNDSWRKAAKGVAVRQGYLANEKACSVRVRAIGQDAFLTVKGAATGLSRPEFEYPIPAADAGAMLDSLCGNLVEKTRYTLKHGAHVWEIDEFQGANAGLVVAEIELGAEDEEFARPDWLGAEVSDDPRYLNARLAVTPFSAW